MTASVSKGLNGEVSSDLKTEMVNDRGDIGPNWMYSCRFVDVTLDVQFGLRTEVVRDRSGQRPKWTDAVLSRSATSIRTAKCRMF